MYDADYEDYLREERFVTKDSGTRAEHPDGVVRDTDQGKPRFDLLFPKDVPFEKQLMTRVAELYERGGVKYGMRNWEKSNTEETLAHHEAALMRHVVRFLIGTEDGEDHAAAVVWNVNAVDLCRQKIAESAAVPADVPKLRTYKFPLPDPEHSGYYKEYCVDAPDYASAVRAYQNYYDETGVNFDGS